MDARIMCGQDVRRSGLWPTDSARLESFIAQYGGVIEASPIGQAAIMLRWTKGEITLNVSGVTIGDALQKLESHYA